MDGAPGLAEPPKRFGAVAQSKVRKPSVERVTGAVTWARGKAVGLRRLELLEGFWVTPVVVLVHARSERTGAPGYKKRGQCRPHEDPNAGGG
jgi:hypothetical protein